MASVHLHNVAKSFGSDAVVRGVSLAIDHGEFVALVGPSGSGKSTLLRMIAGLEEVSGGTIEIGGRVVNDVPPKLRDIAMVFQNYALYPHMTVAQNLGFALRMRGLDRGEIDRRVAAAAASLGLDTLLDRYPRQLSGGQRQRVATGRAIVRDPQVFLFDEPLSNLDAKLRVQMRAELRQLHRRLGVTSIYVTHDQVEAMTMADRIVVLRDGAVEQVGRPLELYDRPANVFVGGFIGSPAMNLLVGTYRGGGLALADGTRLPVRATLDLAEGAALTVGFRPEDVRVGDEGGLAATLLAIEPTGAETMLVAQARGGDTITVVSRDRIDLPAGVAVRLAPILDKHHYFDAAGQRLDA